MKFIGNRKFLGLALILGIAVCPFFIEKANADSITAAHESWDTSSHEGSQIGTGQNEDELTHDNSTEAQKSPQQLKPEGEV